MNNFDDDEPINDGQANILMTFEFTFWLFLIGGSAVAAIYGLLT